MNSRSSHNLLSNSKFYWNAVMWVSNFFFFNEWVGTVCKPVVALMTEWIQTYHKMFCALSFFCPVKEKWKGAESWGRACFWWHQLQNQGMRVSAVWWDNETLICTAPNWLTQGLTAIEAIMRNITLFILPFDKIRKISFISKQFFYPSQKQTYPSSCVNSPSFLSEGVWSL